MNLGVVEEGEVDGEQEGEEVYNDVKPYAYDPNESKRTRKACH